MDLIIFLQSFFANNNVQQFQYPIVIFTGSSYFPLFFSLLLSCLKKQINNYQAIDLETIDSAHLKSKLEISFLDQQLCYWAGSGAMLSPQKFRAFSEFLVTYQGPHSIWFHSDQSLSLANSVIIEMPEAVDKEEFIMIAQLLFPAIKTNKKKLIDSFFEKYKKINLDNACLLMNYIMVLNATHAKEFMSSWADTIIAQDYSLFSLSSYFFAQEQALFIDLWRAIEPTYAFPFWITFWSDQLYRATAFVLLANECNFTQAKQISQKLPFSFIKKDWKLYKAHQLANAHHALYELDYHFKNGASEIGLEVFYAKFFAER